MATTKKRHRRNRRHGRHLSQMDHFIFKGKLNRSSLVKNMIPSTTSTNGSGVPTTTTANNINTNADNLEVHYIHIPKTGGDSVMLDSPYHLLQGQTLQGNTELPYEVTKRTQLQPGKHTRKLAIVFLRQPASHVLSQFLECKYDVWGQKQTKNTNFPGYGRLANVMAGFDEWINHFASHPNRFEPTKGRYAFRCYDPWNLQTRYMSVEAPTGLRAHYYHKDPTAPSKGGEHPSLEIAKSNLRQDTNNNRLVVGITEHFAASMCLLEYRATNGYLSKACRTCATTNNNTSGGTLSLVEAHLHHLSHGVPKNHSIDMITNVTTLQQIQTITKLDQQLYDYAYHTIFQNEIDLVYNTTGIDLLCRRPQKRPSPLESSGHHRHDDNNDSSNGGDSSSLKEGEEEEDNNNKKVDEGFDESVDTTATDDTTTTSTSSSSSQSSSARQEEKKPNNNKKERSSNSNNRNNETKNIQQTTDDDNPVIIKATTETSRTTENPVMIAPKEEETLGNNNNRLRAGGIVSGCGFGSNAYYADQMNALFLIVGLFLIVSIRQRQQRRRRRFFCFNNSSNSSSNNAEKQREQQIREIQDADTEEESSFSSSSSSSFQ